MKKEATNNTEQENRFVIKIILAVPVLGFLLSCLFPVGPFIDLLSGSEFPYFFCFFLGASFLVYLCSYLPFCYGRLWSFLLWFPWTATTGGIVIFWVALFWSASMTRGDWVLGLILMFSLVFVIPAAIFFVVAILNRPFSSRELHDLFAKFFDFFDPNVTDPLPPSRTKPPEKKSDGDV